MSHIKREPLLQIAKKLQGDSFGAPLIVKAIEEAPIEDVVEIKHGEWRFKEYGEDTYTNLTRVYECSLCGRTIECLNEADEPYCHCGAKMDGERRTDNDSKRT